MCFRRATRRFRRSHADWHPYQEGPMKPDPATKPPPPLDQHVAAAPLRAQILATEHWSLLATRSMTWNEIFSRTGTFLTVLSATVVALSLVAQATDFGNNFRVSHSLSFPSCSLSD
jgi:hypothetical protein